MKNENIADSDTILKTATGTREAPDVVFPTKAVAMTTDVVLHITKTVVDDKHVLKTTIQMRMVVAHTNNEKETILKVLHQTKKEAPMEMMIGSNKKRGKVENPGMKDMELS